MFKGNAGRAFFILCCWLWPILVYAEQIIEFPLDLELVGQRSEITGYVSAEDPDYWAISGDELFVRLQPYLTNTRLSQLAPKFLERKVDQRFFTDLGWQGEYNEAELLVKIVIPAEERRSVDLNFVNRGQGDLPENLPQAEPAMFSGVVNAYLTHTHNLSETEFYGDSLALRTGMAMGPLTLEDGHSYFRSSGAQDNSWQRDTSRLLYDIPDRGGFLQLGDYQTATDIQRLNAGELFGLSYSYQPEYINSYMRPNMVPLTLESSALVTIRINGEEYKTLRLAPGQYNLRDLPVANGVNEVEISYLDQGGITVTRYYSLIDNPRLLLPGDWETQWVAGYQQGYNVQGIKEIDENKPAAQAVVAYGLTPWWTMSPRIAWGKSQQEYGLLQNFAVGDNFLTLNTQRQENENLRTGNYNLGFFMPTLAWDTLSNANLSYHFTDQDKDSQQGNQFDFNFTAGLNTPMENGYVSFALNSGFENQKNIRNSASINSSYRIWERLSVGLNFRWEQNQESTERSFYLSLSMPIGIGTSNVSARSRYDSNKERVESELSVSDYSPKQSWRGSINLVDDQYESADLYYRRNGPRVNGNVRLTSRNESSLNSSRSASIGLESGLAWAGSNIAWTSPLGSSFSIVSLSDEFEGYALEQGSYGRLKIIPAEQGGARSAVVNVANRHNRLIKVNAEELDFDEEMEYSEFVAIGGLRRGSAFELSLLSGFFITGILVDDNNSVLVDKVGELTEQNNGKTYPFYTGEMGGFELDMVPAGNYELRLYDDNYAPVVVTVDGEDAENDIFVDMKTIELSLTDQLTRL